MIIQPKVRGFICTSAHPTGLKKALADDLGVACFKGKVNAGKFVLVIGASMGYGLCARAVSAIAGGADTLGVIFDRPATDMRTASAGWYNTAALEEFAAEKGLYFKTVNADAFDGNTKQKVIDTLKADGKKIDCVIYSVAAPRRTLENGETAVSVLKTVGKPFTNKTIDLRTRQVGEITVPAASEEEIAATVKVMGGEDWEKWIAALKENGLLSESAVTAAFSYIGPKITHPIYKDGSIGKAKADLKRAADSIEKSGVKAYVCVNKAIVTQSSSAIPVVPLYISMLYKVMKAKGTHEGAMAQMQRLFGEKNLLGGAVTDEDGLIRLDDREMADDVQSAVLELWNKAGQEPIEEITDLKGYDDDFLRLFGFGVRGVDYGADENPSVEIKNLI